MNEPQKTNPYAAAIFAPFTAMLMAGYIIWCGWHIYHGQAGFAAGDSVIVCLSLAATIYHVRIIWLELRKSDPHYQKP